MNFGLGKKRLDTNTSVYIMQYIIPKLRGFARVIKRLGYSLNVLTDDIDDIDDIELLKKRLKKSRLMLGEELVCVANLIHSLALELNSEPILDNRLGRILRTSLRSKGVECEQVFVYKGNKNLEVNITKQCNGECGRCIKSIVPQVSRLLGVKMNRACDICTTNGRLATLRLCCETPWRISQYAISKKRDGSTVSGDSHTFMQLKYGKYMLALSDGMGSGTRAREESAASVELFEDFMEAGFERDIALEQINSLLLMRAGDDDIFATLDICNIDLYEGVAEFVKIGGMPSFIANKGGVRLIGSGGLPVGIMDNAAAQSTAIALNSGDVIVMVTDGVTEAAPCVIGKEMWLARLIEQNYSLPPEKLCNKIIDEAIKADGNRIRDDMTVLVARLWC